MHHRVHSMIHRLQNRKEDMYSHLCLFCIGCCCWSLDAVLYETNFDIAWLPVLFLPGVKFVSLKVKISCSSGFSDILVQMELLNGLSAICPIQDPLDLHELVFWDVFLFQHKCFRRFDPVGAESCTQFPAFC